jgi:hypothetical protein
MVADGLETLSGFIDRAESSEKMLVLVNRTGPEPLWQLLDRAFDDQSVAVRERSVPEGTDDIVLLMEDGEVTATSTMKTLEAAFLMVNSDRYRTGTSGLDVGEIPDVLTGLDEIEFTVRGFPASNKEKLLLIVISRFIEGRALDVDDGRLDVSFQRLSRLDDEYGTKEVYRRLAESQVDTHVYGVTDDPAATDDLDVTVHVGDHDEYRRSWLSSSRHQTVLTATLPWWRSK